MSRELPAEQMPASFHLSRCGVRGKHDHRLPKLLGALIEYRVPLGSGLSSQGFWCLWVAWQSLPNIIGKLVQICGAVCETPPRSAVCCMQTGGRVG